MDAKELIKDYKKAHGLKAIEDPADFRHWIESKTGRIMDRPLFVSCGCGGGQNYMIRWKITDATGNSNAPAYFFSEMPGAIKFLEARGHIQLQTWLDSPSM